MLVINGQNDALRTVAIFSNHNLYLILGYISTLRNNVRSRAWGAAIGCSYRVERCCIVKVVTYLH